MRTQGHRGADFERKVRAKLEERGYFVMRSAGSRGRLDLAAFGKHGDILFVQVKGGRRGMSRADKSALIDLADDKGATPILATRGKNGRGVEFVNLREAA